MRQVKQLQTNRNICKSSTTGCRKHIHRNPTRTKATIHVGQSMETKGKKENHIEQQEWPEARETNLEIKKQVKEDRLKYELEQLAAVDKDGHKWESLKQVNLSFKIS